MKKSVYEKILIVIGLLIAIEILIKLGIQKSLLPLAAEIIIVAILLYFIHKLSEPKATGEPGFQDSTRDSNWQKEHDQWWRDHQQSIPRFNKAKPKPSPHHEQPHKLSKIDQLKINKQYLSHQARQIDEQIKQIKEHRHPGP